MSEYYNSVYKKRLNRYGLDYQSRIQGSREREFNDYLYKSIYRVDFEYMGTNYPGSLERLNQDTTQTQAYLLTKIDVNLPSGSIIKVENNGLTDYWMVWWLEFIQASGYNRYIILKMSKEITWEFDDFNYSSRACFIGTAQAKIMDTVQSSIKKGMFFENNNLHLLIMPYNEAMKKDVYLETTWEEETQAFVVVGIDILSTPGVCYVSLDPVPRRDLSSTPTKTKEDSEKDFYWLEGGAN